MSIGSRLTLLISLLGGCSSEAMTSNNSQGSPAPAGSVAAPPIAAGASAGKPSPPAAGGSAAAAGATSARPAGAAGTAAAPSGGVPGSGTPAAASGGASGASTAIAGAASAAGAAGTTAAGTGASAGAAGNPAATGGVPGAAPTLPPEDDPSAPGAFDVRFVNTAPGLNTHSLFVPSEPGTHGKHPMVVWTCGNSGTVSFYMSFLQHIASHGFLVVADKGSTSDRDAEVASQSAAIDWIIAENGKAGGEYAGKFDVDNIAVMGHSLGSLASFATAAKNEHIATSIHFSGGLTGNPVGFDMSWLSMMTKPAAFLCGGNDTQAGPACAEDFAKAPPTLPVFYATLARADHLGPFLSAQRGGDYGTAGVAWLRWQLADDPAYKSWFSGTACKLCTSPWTAMQRNLN